MNEYLKLIDEQLHASLKGVRSLYSHSVIKGSLLEQSLGSALEDFLPKKYDIGTGQIIDSKKNISPQIDIIIADDSHPIRYKKGSPGLYLIDGVCAIGEVKASLNKQNLEDTIEHSKKTKNLKRFQMNGDITCTNLHDKERYYIKPPYFLFAFESSLKEDDILNIVKVKIPEINTGIDGIFIVGKKPIINLGNGNGSIKSLDKEGNRFTGWIKEIDTSTMARLLFWLHGTMPNVIRTNPIIMPYLKT